MSWLSIVSKVGTNSLAPDPRNRPIILTNEVSLTLACFTVLTTLAGLAYFGFILTIKLALGASVVYLLPLLLNSLGLFNASRLVLCISLSASAVALSIFDKFEVPGQLEQFQYFHLRLMLLAASIFPFILFKLSERRYWTIGMLFNLLCLALFDPLHEWVGVGFYQMGLHSPNYYFLNIITIATFLVLAGSTYFLKNAFEKSEAANDTLINDLNKAKAIIELQSIHLTQENLELNKELVTKNNQLEQTNEELIRHNNELMQFSYTVSHNLRGPVASMIGLLSLFEKNNLTQENETILQHLATSIESLDATIRDLGNIIDIRNRVLTIRQSIHIEEEWQHVQNLLAKEIAENEVQFGSQFDITEWISVRSMLSSILYNLLSNAIKYKSPLRTPLVTLRTQLKSDFVLVQVSDNGLGIDLKLYGEKLFGLYKRFHTHTEGKGIGLFIVKLQAEVLGGSVQVESELNVGTTITLQLPLSGAKA